jgi:hypothetical protein
MPPHIPINHLLMFSLHDPKRRLCHHPEFCMENHAGKSENHFFWRHPHPVKDLLDNRPISSRRGRVEICLEKPDGTQQIVGTRGPGTIIGEMALIDDAPRTATVRAVEDCKLIEITREDFTRRLQASDPVMQAVFARPDYAVPRYTRPFGDYQRKPRDTRLPKKSKSILWRQPIRLPDCGWRASSVLP